jgi:hypothetical protein
MPYDPRLKSRRENNMKLMNTNERDVDSGCFFSTPKLASQPCDEGGRICQGPRVKNPFYLDYRLGPFNITKMKPVRRRFATVKGLAIFQGREFCKNQTPEIL